MGCRMRQSVILTLSPNRQAPCIATGMYNDVAIELSTDLVPRPNVHQYLNEMNKKVLSHYDCMSVGEMPGDLNPYEASKYVAKERKELSMVFQFAHMNIVSCYLWSVILCRLTIIRKMDLAGSGMSGHGNSRS